MPITAYCASGYVLPVTEQFNLNALGEGLIPVRVIGTLTGGDRFVAITPMEVEAVKLGIGI